MHAILSVQFHSRLVTAEGGLTDMANQFSDLAFENTGVLPHMAAKSGRYGRPPSIFQVMPRGMYFGPSRATSIDLCVRALSLASAFRTSTTILAEAVADPFPGFAILDLPQASRAATFTRANYVSRLAKRLSPDVIVVQQHLPTAAAIAARLRIPVVLHAHNFQKDHRGVSIGERTHRAFKKGRYRRLAGIIHVSRACADMFAEAWPDVNIPSCVVNNGLDFDEWNPRPVRREEILYVGRCSPEKGVLEAAIATTAILSKYPSWRAQFILSAVEVDPDYFRRVQEVLAAHGSRALIKVQRPFAEVKAAFEAAAIALAPSHRPESFGRTALEAHAGGAALISSGAGGLAEVSDDCALMLPAVHDREIARAIDTLIRHCELRQKLARTGAERVREMFRICAQAVRFDAFCEQLCAGGRESNPYAGFGIFN
jgi:glycosyltransferase involved in cell wall biosynthesis